MCLATKAKWGGAQKGTLFCINSNARYKTRMNKVSVQLLNEYFNVSGEDFIWVNDKDLDTSVYPSWNRGKKTGVKPWLGKKHTEATKRKVSEARKGIIFTQEHRDNIGKAFACKYKLTFKNGKEIIIENMNKFCKETSYGRRNLINVMTGYRKRHKDIVAVEKLDTTS